MSEPKQQNQNPSNSQFSPPVEDQDHKKATAEETRQELDEAVKGAHDVICEITTPLQLSPVTITLDRAKLSASKRKFMTTTSIFSMPMNDLLNVTAEVGFMLGYVKIDRQVPADEPYKLGPFWRKEAITMANLAEGYIVALQRQIDLSPLPLNELKTKLLELGGDKNVSPTDPLP